LSMAYDTGSKAGNWPLTERHKELNNAIPVAGNIAKFLTPKEQSGVAKLLMEVVEGAEVVVMKAISSTSVMINACYDMFSEGIGIVPSDPSSPRY
ncbi:MAG: P44/Msp2 family outer membrane protein, partial [Aaplasma endosymbiont of Hyalomma asiaticum]